MSFEIKVWLYGLGTAKTKSKNLKRISLDEISRAKAFHVFIRELPKGKWKRITSEPELIPTTERSKADKRLYIDSYVSFVQEELEPTPLPEEIELKLPEIPKPKRVSKTKKQFTREVSKLLKTEAKKAGVKYSDNRVLNFIDKLWASFSKAPQIVLSDLFKNNLVIQEIKRITDSEKRKKKKEKDKKLQEQYRKKLQDKEFSISPLVDAKVEIKFKEIFRTDKLRKPDEQTISLLDRSIGEYEEIDRQTAFVQINAEYDAMIYISAEQALDDDTATDYYIEKVKQDMYKLFDEAIEKGLFRPSNKSQYLFRLIVPLLDAKGMIPETYKNIENKKAVGQGFSIPRQIIKTKEDLELTLDYLFSFLRPAMARYIKLNHMSGYAIAGFSMERLLI